MVTLVLVFCLGSGNIQCVEHHPVYEVPLSLMACMIWGPVCWIGIPANAPRLAS
jgi:hypothetical protein